MAVVVAVGSGVVVVVVVVVVDGGIGSGIGSGSGTLVATVMGWVLQTEMKWIRPVRITMNRVKMVLFVLLGCENNVPVHEYTCFEASHTTISATALRARRRAPVCDTSFEKAFRSPWDAYTFAPENSRRHSSCELAPTAHPPMLGMHDDR